VEIFENFVSICYIFEFLVSYQPKTKTGNRTAIGKRCVIRLVCLFCWFWKKAFYYSKGHPTRFILTNGKRLLVKNGKSNCNWKAPLRVLLMVRNQIRDQNGPLDKMITTQWTKESLGRDVMAPEGRGTWTHGLLPAPKVRNKFYRANKHSLLREGVSNASFGAEYRMTFFFFLS